MKKFLLTICLTLLISVPSFAYDAASRVDAIGKTILTKNSIAITGVKFAVDTEKTDNSTYANTKVITISKNDLQYAGNDNEVAAIVADTLGHIISGHAAQGQLASLFVDTTTTDTTTKLLNSYYSSKQNKEADVIAVNLMANSGYNPLALTVILTKQPVANIDALLGKPANADRALNVYEYANFAYPETVKAGYNCNEYKTFLSYAKSTIETRNAKTTKKVNKDLEKSRKNSVSKISKFRTRGGVSEWDTMYKILTTTTTTTTTESK